MLIYPYNLNEDAGYPKKNDFTISKSGEKGMGVYTRRSFRKGELVARFTGEIVSEIMLHTLQIEPGKHLHDPYFSGFILHSCCPNTRLDMKELKIWAKRDIHAGEAITMDYATTEDVLHRQFPCGCSAANCRTWITGQKEIISSEGRTYLKKLNEQREKLNVSKAG